MTILGYDWPHLHAAVNDFPAAVLVLAVLFDLGAAAFKRESLKWAGIWSLWAGVIGGWAAVLAGEQAEDVIDHGEAIHEIMETHETLALITMGIFTLVLVWQLWRRFNPGVAEGWILRVLSIAGLVFLVATGREGGELYFDHAAGVPTATMKAELENRAEPHQHHPGEADDDDDHAAPADTSHHDAPGTPPHAH
ncbi:MAG TPA: DUF2231 domain-containing protein [Gemmatimonadales bacterium]